MHDTNLLEDQPIAWTPTPEVIERSRLMQFMRQVGVSTWDELYEFSIRDVEKFTEEVLKFLDIKFDPPYERLLDTSDGIEFPRWFGRADEGVRVPGADEGVRVPSEGVRVPTAGLNITEMCLDRWQTDEMKDQPAVIWEGEDGSEATLSYAQLFNEVAKCADGLRAKGLRKGDAIGVHMPMIPETVIALLAINRIGGIAVPVFSGYGVEAIVSRMNAVGAKALFTCPNFTRRGKAALSTPVGLEAAGKCPTVKIVFLVAPKTKPQPGPLKPGKLSEHGRKLIESYKAMSDEEKAKYHRNQKAESNRKREEFFIHLRELNVSEEKIIEIQQQMETQPSGGGSVSFGIHDISKTLIEHPYRTHFWQQLLDGGVMASTEDSVEPTSAEDPLIILYTSGTTGKPKGIAHTHASFPIKAAQDMAFGTDVGRGTRICWYTDIGWMMGPWLIYGALINGATICIYDGAPDYPTPDRMWEFCAKHKVEVLGISPTLIRALAAAEERHADPERNADALVRTGVADASVRPSADVQAETKPTHAAEGVRDPSADEGVRVPSEGVRVPAPFERHDLSSLSMFASTGEPWNPAPWWWLFEEVGNSKLPIINYSGGTEIAGGILMGNPLLPQKPCSFPAPCPGMDVDILDEEGNPVEPGKVGELVIRQPWIGMARGFWQEKERYLDTYWRRFKDIWVHGDWAMRDKDGHWFILGRSDDTLKVAGKRVGPAEVESLLVAHPMVTEAAVIGVPDEVKGTAMVAFVVLGNADALVRTGDADASVRPSADIFANKRGWHRRGYLPHFDGVVTQFITFRLADSLSREVLKRIKRLSENDPADPAKEYRRRLEEYLDRGIGECILRDPRAARIVEETLLREDGKSIDLIAWVIMPNHAHVMMRPLEGHSLSDIMQTVKSVSAHRINKELGRTGAVWQPDYFDRYIRDTKHFRSAVQYIENNPVKAGLCAAKEEWEFSSAAVRTHADEGVRVPGADEGVRVPSEGVRVPSLEEELKALVAKDMGKPLAPSKIHFVSALPKTRNAKVMRRVIRAAYLGEDAGDLSALENPQAVEEIAQAGK